MVDKVESVRRKTMTERKSEGCVSQCATSHERNMGLVK